MADTLVTHDSGKQLAANALLTALGANARVKLIKATFTQNAALVYGDLTFANFSGYADWTPTFGSPGITGGVSIADGGTHDFIHNGGGTANDIYGAALVDNSGPTLISTIKFDSSKSMASNLDTLHGATLLRLLTE